MSVTTVQVSMVNLQTLAVAKQESAQEATWWLMQFTGLVVLTKIRSCGKAGGRNESTLR
jgi:hypothetical protein